MKWNNQICYILFSVGYIIILFFYAILLQDVESVAQSEANQSKADTDEPSNASALNTAATGENTEQVQVTSVVLLNIKYNSFVRESNLIIETGLFSFQHHYLALNWINANYTKKCCLDLKYSFVWGQISYNEYYENY